jgi:hypothetical protein
MKRITVQDVRRAYEVTGLKPTNCDWGDGVKCGCPLTAVLAADGDCSPADAASDLVDNDPYCTGFICGVDDDLTGSHERSPKFLQGYTDGLEVRSAIFGDTACAE